MDDTAGSGGAARRRTTGSPAKPPGKTRAKAATGSGRAAAAPAKRASGTSRTARTRTAPAGPEPGPGGPGWSGPPERAGWRASRSRALYSRRIQRVNERWPLATQVATALLSRPELVLGALGQPQPIARDGRLLNRRVQAMLELATRLDGARATGGGGPSGDPVELRAQLRRATQLAMPVRTDVHGWGRVVPGPDGAPPVPVRLYRQYGTGLGLGGDGRSLPGIVYYHGGSWVTGDLDTHDATCRLLAATARCLVVAVDYRRAPEDPFPAAVDDAVAAYVWVQRHADELGIDRRRIGVMGDSAGGNLAAVVALEARAGGSVAAGDVLPPAAQGLVYPVVDARLDTESLRQLGEDFFLTRAGLEQARGWYLPDGSDWTAWRASPLLAADHRDVAPALVVTAGFDPLRDDGVNYADVLRAAGVEVEYRCYDDQIHGFMGMGILPESLALATEVCDAMGRLLRRSSETGIPA